MMLYIDTPDQAGVQVLNRIFYRTALLTSTSFNDRWILDTLRGACVVIIQEYHQVY